jgi:hypothetical protein
MKVLPLSCPSSLPFPHGLIAYISLRNITAQKQHEENVGMSASTGGNIKLFGANVKSNKGRSFITAIREGRPRSTIHSMKL